MTRRRLTRRDFLGVGAGFAAAGVLAACTGSGAETTQNDGRLRVLNWSDYIDPSVIDSFSANTGIFVTYDSSYGSNEDALATHFEPKLFRGKPTGYDIIVPTYWLVERLVKDGLVEPLWLERIPNHVNVDPEYLGMAWDRGARFHMPWQAGITGIAYDPAQTGREIGSVADLFESDLRGRVGMVVEMRETVGLVMLMRGDDPSRATLGAAEAALDRIDEGIASGQIKSFTDSKFASKLKSGEYAACLAWSGDAAHLQEERPDIRFVVPEEGGIRWFDSMIVPRYAANPIAAADWMNYTYDPEVAATIAEYVQYISPILGVREILEGRGGTAAALADNPILFPDEETRRRLYVWSGMATEDEERLTERFNQITAGKVS